MTQDFRDLKNFAVIYSNNMKNSAIEFRSFFVLTLFIFGESVEKIDAAVGHG